MTEADQSAATPPPEPSAHPPPEPSALPPAQLSPRALAVGLVVGAVLALGNLTVGLATGLWDSGQVTASLLAFLLLQPLSRRLRASPLETNAAQTVACAAAAMPAVLGLLGAVPALEKLGGVTLGPALLVLGVALGVLGLLLALLLYRRMVVEEALPFPTGVAAAELISALHGSGAEAARRSRGLIAAGCFALAVVALRDGLPWIFPPLLPGALLLPFALAGVPAASLGLGVAVSPLLAGIGVVAGLRTGASLALGALLGWGALGQAQLAAGTRTPANLGEWLLWPGVALVLAASAVDLGAQLPSLARGVRDLGASLGGAGRSRTAVLLAIAAALVALGGAHFALGLGLLPALASLFAFVILGAVVGRAAGQADFAPISQAGQSAQAAAGPLFALDAARDVAVGALVSGGVAQTSTVLWSLKTGERLSASLREQARAALAGTLFGALVSLPAYALLEKAQGIGGARFPAPSAAQFRAVAELVTSGGSLLPPGAAAAAVVAAVAGALLAALGRTPAGRFLPNAVALGIGFLIPAGASVAVLAGSLLAFAWTARDRVGAEEVLPSVGAGLIAGEALLAFAIAAAAVFGPG